MSAQVCKRSSDCTCPECAAASAAFSVDELKAFSSVTDYDAEATMDMRDDVPPSPVEKRPRPAPKRKPRVNPNPPPEAAAGPASEVQELGAGAHPPPVPTPAAVAEADGISAADAAEAASSGSLEADLVSKDWKVRKPAYQALEKAFQGLQPNDPLFSQYAPFLQKMLQDTNASCVDGALDVLRVYADVCVEAAEHTPTLAPIVVAKGFSGRPGTVTRAEAALLKLMEVDVPDSVVEALLGGLGEKKPKIPPACVATILKALEMFGARAMPLKDIKAALPDLRPAQKAEVDNLVEASKKEGKGVNRKPTVYLRKDRPKARAPDEAAPVEEEKAQAFDPKEFVEPVNLLGKLPKTEFAAKTAAVKWSEILEGLNIAVDLIGPLPKLTPGDYGDIVRQVKRLGDHSHVQVAITSFRLLSLIAEGLGPGFSPYGRGVVGAMLTKLKDKKCAAALGPCLDRIYGNPITLDQVTDEVVTALDSKKAAHARLATLEWLGRCVSKPAPPVDTSTLVAFTKAAVSLLADPDPKIREGASGTISMLVGASKAYKKIKESVGKGGSSASGPPPSAPTSTKGPSPAPAPKAKAPPAKEQKPSPPSHQSGDQDESSKVRPSGGTKNSLTRKARVAPKTAPGGARRGAAATAVEGAVEVEPKEEPLLSPEEAMGKLEALQIEGWEEYAGGLKGANWKDKVAAVDAISTRLQQGSADLLGALIVALSASTKGFKDSNFNVMKAAFNAITSVVQADEGKDAAKANSAALSSALSPAVDKIGDRKLKDTVVSLLDTVSEALGPPWVIRRVVAIAGKAKAPLLHSEALAWLQSCIEDFGSGAVPAPMLISFGVTELDNSNPKVRSTALDVLGCLYHRLGPPMKALLPDLKPALQSQVDDKFDKVGYNPAANANVTRTSAVAEGSTAGGDGGAGGGGLPRIDMTTLLEKDCITRLQCVQGKEAWKGRKLAMEEIIQACKKSGNHLEANKSLIEIAKALTPRLGDSQSNLKPLAATAIAEVASSVSPETAPKLTRVYAEPLLGCVGENRRLMRDAAISALGKITEQGGITHGPTVEALAPPVSVALQNKVGRVELLTWLKGVGSSLARGEGANGIVKPLLDCMQDKSAAVRQVAEECLRDLVAAGSVQSAFVRTSTRDFQPAAMRQLQPALMRVYEASGGAAGGSEDHGEESSSGAPDVEPTPSSTTTSKLTRRAGGSTSSKSVLKPPSRSIRANSLKANRVPSSSSSGPVAEEESEQGSSSPASGPLLPSNKAKRLESEKRSRWFVSSDEPRDHQSSLLKSLWTPLLTAEATDALFPSRVGSMECGSSGFELLSKALNDQPAEFLDSLDLIFKWMSLRLCEKENVKALGQLLELLDSTLQALVSQEYRLADGEVEAVVPILLEKSGQAKERFRVAFRQLMGQVSNLCTPTKYGPLLMQATASKNFRTRAACLQELARLMEKSNPGTVLGKKGGRELAKHIGAGEADVRSVALDVVQAAYMGLERDIGRLYRLLGPINDKAKTLVDERIKAADRKAGGPPSATGSTVQAATTGTAAAGPATPTPKGIKQPASRSFQRGAGDGLSTGVEELVVQPLVVEGVDDPRKKGDGGDGDKRASLGDLMGGMQGIDAGEDYDIGKDYRVDMDNVLDDGPFRFDDSPVKVQLSPRSPSREGLRRLHGLSPECGTGITRITTSPNGSDEEFVTLLREIENRLLQVSTLTEVSAEDRTKAIVKIKAISAWADQQLVEGRGSPYSTLAKCQSKLVSLLTRCLRMSFTGSLTHSHRGAIDAELLKQVLRALEKLCKTSPMLMETAPLTELLREACLCEVEHCVHPGMLNQTYSDGDRDEIQLMLNRIMVASGKADPSVALSAILSAMTDSQRGFQAHGKTTEKILTPGIHAEMLKVYVKLLANLLRVPDDGSSTSGKQPPVWYRKLDLPKVLRVVHSYFVLRRANDQAADQGVVEGSTADVPAHRLVDMFWEELYTSCGRTVVGECISRLSTGAKADQEEERAEAWLIMSQQCDSTGFRGVGNEGIFLSGSRRLSTPATPSSRHSAEIAQLIGDVPGHGDDGEEDTKALQHLRDYIRKHPDARQSFEDQVERLRPSFRQFIREGCKSQDLADSVSHRSTNFTPSSSHGESSVPKDDMGRIGGMGVTLSARKEADENMPRSASGAHDGRKEQAGKEATSEALRRARLQELRRKIASGRGSFAVDGGQGEAASRVAGSGIGGHLPGSGASGDRPQPLKQNNSGPALSSIQERLKAAGISSKLSMGKEETRAALASTSSITERFKRLNSNNGRG